MDGSCLRWVTFVTAVIALAKFHGAHAQGNQEAPKWVESSLDPLRGGVPEDTDIDTLLTTLKCVDPNGDAIRYSLVSGNAVNVRFSGEVRLIVELDFERKGLTYELGFACVDEDANGVAIHDPVVYELVMVPNDANDIPPKFDIDGLDGYSFSVSESDQVGYALQPRIRVSDGDRGSNAILTIHLICNSDDPEELKGLPDTSIEFCEKFGMIHEVSSDTEGLNYVSFILKQEVDYEDKAVYSSKLIAHDNAKDESKRLTATINVQINIIDAQDMDPIFVNLGATAIVSEGDQAGSPVGLAISARDGDFGDKRPVKIVMLEDKKDAFTLGDTLLGANDVYSSSLTVKTQLDREAIPGSYEFVVKVIELEKQNGAETGASATATYSVGVSDIDDMKPTFGKDVYDVDVTEMEFTTEAVQLPGLRIVCIDADEPQNARYNVRIASQTFADVYKVSPIVTFTGSAILFLTVNKAEYLNYDVARYRNQTVVLEAVSTGDSSMSSKTTVNIRLTDINDNRPQFEESSYTLQVSESIIELPHTITTIKATDEDDPAGRNGQIEFKLEGGTSSKFEINKDTGELTMVGLVDYETTPQYVFLVFAQDKAADSQTAQVQVTVEILNANDQKPVFKQSSYQATINEDDRDFLTPVHVRATDNEIGTKSITYSIISGQTPEQSFNLNSITGKLTLNRKLSYSAVENGIYNLVIGASDNGTPAPAQTATVNVKISVIDQNNFSPVMEPKVYTATLSELTVPGTDVTTIKATDEDEGDFGTIHYRISSGAFDNFEINEKTGQVKVTDPQNFDFNIHQSYRVVIVAYDGGAPQLSAEAELLVTIEDANNKDPYFEKSFYIITVDEKEEVGYVMETVVAKDPDRNQSLAYSIPDSSITARNGLGNEVNSIFPYNYREAIGVRRDSGELFIRNKLDKEETLEIQFIVQVEDLFAGTMYQTASTRVAITVTGEVNTDLSFDRMEQSFVNEGAPVGYEITTVTARDPTNQDVNYQAIGGSEFFDIDFNSGQITLIKEVDYEKDIHTHELLIQAIAKDGIRKLTATVTIKIKDDNDNAPVFNKPVYTAQVDEDAQPLQPVAEIFASDADTTSFGPIEYSIGGGLDSDHFLLYPTSRGVSVLVNLNTKLNYNNRQFYDLDIIARDNPTKKFSNVQQSTSVKLKITVIDKNNNKPKFIEEGETRKMSAAETAPVGTSIGTVVATDDDFGLNGEVIYELQALEGDKSSRAALQLFTIVQRAGIVSVKQNLLGIGGSTYRVKVFARDLGEPFLSSTLNLIIDVLSTENNDGNPLWTFPDNNFVFTAPEETPNYQITTNGENEIVFEATPRQGQVLRFVLSEQSEGYEYFHVETVDDLYGKLRVNASLDRDAKESYNLLVYAEDQDDPLNKRTGRQMVVQLLDKKDSDPTFTNPMHYPSCPEAIDQPQEIYVTENIPAGRLVYALRACDPDIQDPLSYERYTVNDENFDCNDSTPGLEVRPNGDIVTTKVLDYEETRHFRLCVVVQDTAGRAGTRKKRATYLSNVAYIEVFVRDENDNAPKFPSDHVVAVMETDARDYPVVLLDAVDRDGVGFSVPVYTITETKFYPAGVTKPIYPGRAFTIKNNEIHPDPPRGYTFQNFARGRFVLTVRAQDPVNPAFSDTQTVTIFVHDRGQAMKVILSMEAQQGINYGEEIVTKLNDASADHTFRYLHVSIHNGKDGIDRSRTDVCFIAINDVDNTILNTLELVSLLGQSEFRVILGDTNYEIQDRGKCYPSKSSEEQMKWKDLWWALVFLAIFLGFCALIFIVIIIVMHKKYRKYMKTKKTYLVPG